MATASSYPCRVPECKQEALRASSAELLCLDHFLEQTFSHATHALEQCRQNVPLDPAKLEWLLAHARVVTQLLIGEPSEETAEQRDNLLELLLCLSNLQEYVRHHSVTLPRRDETSQLRKE